MAEFKYHNHILTQLKEKPIMKQFIIAISAFALLFACTPEKAGDNTPTEPVVPEGAVDLGIVMTRTDGTTYKLYWATSNLCEDGLCSNPEDYGDYYAWGETSPHYSSLDPLTWKSGKTGGYTWTSYSLCDGQSVKINKYNYNALYGTVDNMTEFKDYDYVHDAARANEKLGGKWRIPTEAEWTELRTKCTWTWTTQNGVNGRLVTAENGNSIFLPAAGKWEWTNLSNEGTSGGYWSSSLSMAGPVDARYVYIDAGDVGGYGYNRCFGFSIRPVSE